MDSAHVGERFLHILMDQLPPIDRTDSGHRTKQGVGHGDVEPLRYFHTKDRQNKLYHPPLSRVWQFPGWNPSFGSRSVQNFPT